MSREEVIDYGKLYAEASDSPITNPYNDDDRGDLTMKFVICTNNEILSDGTCFFESDSGLDIRSIVDAAVAAVTKHDDLDFDTDSDFSSWRGGRYYQLWNVCGFVAIPKDADKSWEAVAYAIHDAMTAEIANQERLEQESA